MDKRTYYARFTDVYRCIGQSFAKSEMKCILLALILRFRFELTDPNAEVKVSGFVTIKPAGGMKLKLYDLEKEQALDSD